MTVDEFALITEARIPTPAEFKAFADGLGWAIVRRSDGTARLRAPRNDPLATTLARMLAREPWRTEVLRLASESPPGPKPDPAPAAVRPGRVACRLCLRTVDPVALSCGPADRPLSFAESTPAGRFVRVDRPPCPLSATTAPNGSSSGS